MKNHKNNNDIQNKDSTNMTLSRVEHIGQLFQGPIPPPNIMEAYDRILPGSADRILKLTEQQFEHRIAIENKVIDSKIISERRGTLLGFSLAVFIILASVILILKDKDIAGLAGIIITVTSLLLAFMYGKKSNIKELENKKEKNEE